MLNDRPCTLATWKRKLSHGCTDPYREMGRGALPEYLSQAVGRKHLGPLQTGLELRRRTQSGKAHYYLFMLRMKGTTPGYWIESRAGDSVTLVFLCSTPAESLQTHTARPDPDIYGCEDQQCFRRMCWRGHGSMRIVPAGVILHYENEEEYRRIMDVSKRVGM